MLQSVISQCTSSASMITVSAVFLHRQHRPLNPRYHHDIWHNHPHHCHDYHPPSSLVSAQQRCCLCPTHGGNDSDGGGIFSSRGHHLVLQKTTQMETVPAKRAEVDRKHCGTKLWNIDMFDLWVCSRENKRIQRKKLRKLFWMISPQNNTVQ